MANKLSRMNKTARHQGRKVPETNQSKGLTPTPNGSISQAPPTVWSSLTDNSLATPDAYGGVGSGTMGTMTKRHQLLNGGGALAGLQSLLSGGALSGLNGALGGIKDIGNTINQGINFYKQVERAAMGGGNALERISNVLGVSSSGLSSMLGTGGALTQFIGSTNQLQSVVQGLSKASQITMKIGSTVSAISKVDFSDLSQVSGLLNKIASDTSGTPLAFLSDVSTKALFAADIVNRMSQLKIPGVVGEVAKLFTGDKLGLHLFSKNVIKESLRSSDIKGLYSIIKSIGAGKFKSHTPMFSRDLSIQFRYNSIQQQKDKKKLFNEVIELLKAGETGKNSFMYYESKGVYDLSGTLHTATPTKDKHLNVASFINASDDFRDLMRVGIKTNDNKEMKALFVGMFLKGRTLKEEIKRTVPLALITENTINRNSIKAPTQIGRI